MQSLVIALDTPKFPLGDVVITSNASDQLDFLDVVQGISRHASGDWGEICPEDRQENEGSLQHEGRLMSVYRSGGKRFWIITEWDRSVTTVLMPQDY
jgi:hypothetical protein